MIVGMGVDIVELARVQRMLARHGERIVTRLFTEHERAYALPRAQSAASLAARIAAKEAAYKALAGSELARGISWREIEVLNGADGAPRLVLHGRADRRAREVQATHILVSLTHSDASAVAVVVLER